MKNKGKHSLNYYIKQLDRLNKLLDDVESYKKTYWSDVKDIASNLIKIKERDYITKVQDIDVSINIAQGLMSFSVAFLIAFISIPSLRIELFPPFILLIITSLVLILLLYYRKKKSNELNYFYLKEISSWSNKLLDRVKNRSDLTKDKLDLIKKQTDAFRSLLKKEYPVINKMLK